MSHKELGPQPGPQTEFLESMADIVIYGGAAGGGKTVGLLLEPLRHYYNERFGGVIFRRNSTQVFNPGGLWDEATKMYVPLMAQPLLMSAQYKFPSGAKIKFAHLEYEKTVYNWQGAQVPFIGFDELTHFTEFQFFYMLGRNRSDSEIPGYVRATCNPDVDSWVRSFISWWIDKETGLAIPERSGVIRWFARIDERLFWADTKEALIDRFGEECTPKSVTFIAAKLEDNKILMKNDPTYIANLNALPRVERMRLKEGNWNVRATAGMLFQRAWFPIVDAVPEGGIIIRYWDRAATEAAVGKDPARTAGVKLKLMPSGQIYVMDVIKGQWSPHNVEKNIQNTATQDGKKVIVGIEQDPGQAGKVEAGHYMTLLAGFIVRKYVVTKDKVTRAGPISAQSEAGNVKLVRGEWNKDFLDELESFPEGKKKDQVDAFSGAYNALTDGRTGEFTTAMASGNIKPHAPSMRGGEQW